MITDLLNQFEQGETEFYLSGGPVETELFEHPDQEKWNNKDCPRCRTPFSCVMKGIKHDYRYRCTVCGILID